MRFFMISTCLLSFAAVARAEDSHVLLVKSVSSPATLVTTTCEMFSNKVVITRDFGRVDQPGFSTKAVSAFSVSPGFAEVVAAARAETLGDGRVWCSGGTEYVAVWAKNQDATFGRVVLKFCGSSNEDAILRSGDASERLRTMARYTCGF